MPDLAGAIHDLLWSAWTELGLPGVARRHRRVASDPEPLLVYTIHLSRRDPRLVGLVYDWCACHAGRLSSTRLTKIARIAPESVRRAFARFNAALRREGVNWTPAAEDAMRIERTRATVALPMERPALVRFRVRALAGVSTRAEILSRLLAMNPSEADSGRLTSEGVSRRSVERTLLELSAAGLVLTIGKDRGRRYRLRDGALFSRLLGATKLSWLEWKRVLDLAYVLDEFSSEGVASPRLRRINAVSAGEVVKSLAASLPVVSPPELAGREDAVEALVAWGTTQLADLGEIEDRSPWTTENR